jgi:hypothetical protein
MDEAEKLAEDIYARRFQADFEKAVDGLKANRNRILGEKKRLTHEISKLKLTVSRLQLRNHELKEENEALKANQ